MGIPQQMLRIPTMNFDESLAILLEDTDMKKLTKWLNLFILTWLFLPLSVKVWINKISLPELSDGCLLLIVTIAISTGIYYLIDVIFSARLANKP
ncbi:hypothetical protein HPC38_02445 [Pasteurellaceae bacterium HPA106]|uniref:hypothetical protein n=1 Tax=Spirabiliibacterium pneumoniae TaxID=221400 RepID=UPI001AAD8564|nr:hypothetical protein [Spirabiliibacterium pneumoniae]MBE2895739.1 hypothetical protein [Spirabiliibacterium pneumoniae]